MSIRIVARGSDTLYADGTASGAPIDMKWFEETDSVDFSIPADFRPGIDQISLPHGILLTFSEGSIEEFNPLSTPELVIRDQFTVNAISRRVTMAWDYIPHGAGEGERVSSSDLGEEELVFCAPGDWVDFRLGLEVRVVADTVVEIGVRLDTTGMTLDTTVVDGATVIDTTWIVEERPDTVRTINGFVPAASDSVGVVSLLYRRIDGYRVYRANIANPSNFEILRDFSYCDSADVPFLTNDPIQYLDVEGVHNDFPYNYFVVAYDTLTGKDEVDSVLTGDVIPRSNGTEDLSRILVVPNPYKRRAAWEASGPRRLQFTHLPPQAEIRVYTVGGDLVRRWEHHDNQGGGSSSWDLRNGEGNLVVSGVYLYYVKSLAPSGGEHVGKFLVIQ